MERQIIQNFARKGAVFAERTAGSHSPFDAIIIIKDKLLLIQSKNQNISEKEIEKIRKTFPQLPKELDILPLVATKIKGKIVYHLHDGASFR